MYAGASRSDHRSSRSANAARRWAIIGTLIRYLLSAFLLLVLLMGAFGAAVELAGREPDTRSLARLGLRRAEEPPLRWRAGAWAVESAGLLALFLLVQGRSGAWWLDGLVAGWIAWIFRGPVQVLTIATWSRLPPEPWWPLARQQLVLYTLCGLAMAILARRRGRRREGAAEPGEA